MPNSDHSHIDPIRKASRKMVRELGFMQTNLAATNYQPSAVHAMVEIGEERTLTAAQLADIMNLEKSSISRMVRKLVEAGELKETISDNDGRAKLLSLTPQGKRTLASINTFAQRQVASAIDQLSDYQQRTISQGLQTYAAALENSRLGNSATSNQAITIKQGYLPGVIGRVTEMHASFYSSLIGFGQFFESQVATGITEFTTRLTNPQNGLWVALDSGRIAGSIAIDGEHLGQNLAHLRWFIVDDSLRSAGVGRQLLGEAISFCKKQHFAEVHLWTFQGLDSARRLYEKFGFVLAEERTGNQWGKEVVEQRFVLK